MVDMQLHMHTIYSNQQHKEPYMFTEDRIPSVVAQTDPYIGANFWNPFGDA